MIRTTLSQARYFVLQKTYLAAEQAPGLSALVDRLVGLPADPTITPALSGLARIQEFATDSLAHDQNLIRADLMHHSPYLVSVDRFPALHAATTRQRNQALNAELRLWGVETNAEIEQLADMVLELMDDSSKTVGELESRLPPQQVKRLNQTSRGGRISTTSNVALALRWLAGRGDVIELNIAEDWREVQLAYIPLAAWQPGLALSDVPGEAEAQKMLVRAYLAAFGPATEADISFWTGLGKSETARATGALANETTLTLVQGLPGMLLMLKSQAEALNAVAEPVEPVINILPANDPFTSAHRASRARYLADPSLQRRVFESSGASKPAIVVNGQIVGVWDWPGDSVTWQLLSQVDPAVTLQIEAGMRDVAGFIDPALSVSRVE